MRYYTPLRYPGGKARLSHYMRQVFIENDLLDGVYVEPYAGGAGIALELLMTDYAREIWLNDIDPAVHAFWYAALHHTDEMLQLVRDAPLTIGEWRKQHDVYVHPEGNNCIALGFAALFLNRTNRSGILNGGVIGGFKQTGRWGIDARFNRERLAARLKRIGQYRHRIRLFNQDAERFLKRADLPATSLTYLDPPYFHRGQRLYRNHYTREDHERIAKLVQERLCARWIVSYDDVRDIEDFYRARRRIRYSLQYSAQNKRCGGEVMIFCDDLRLPRAKSPAQFRLN